MNIDWDKPVILGRDEVYLSRPLSFPKETGELFVGRDRELSLCRAAWAISEDGKSFIEGAEALNFRLEGPPGVGKNRLVYELCKGLDAPFFSVVGHEELTPEDLAVVVIPDSAERSRFRLRASPLATAVLVGGIFFFDEINRAPPRALSPLSSILDGRQSVYSAIMGRSLEPIDDQARARFRFCCALNPEGTNASLSGLPEYVEERTLPVINVGHLDIQALEILVRQRTATFGKDFVTALLKRNAQRGLRELSLRQLMTMLAFAENLVQRGESTDSALDEAFKQISVRP